MGWELPENTNDAHAGMSIVWLLGWAVVLPFAHVSRLLAYGLLPFALLIALTVLFPGASILAPVLITPSFALEVPEALLPYGSIIGWAIWALTFVLTGFLLCVWQRDILHRFRDPLGKLITDSAARLLEYLLMMLIWAMLVIGVSLAVESASVAVVLVLAIGCITSLETLTPLIAAHGWKAALAVWKVGRGRVVGHLLTFAILGLLWIGILALLDYLGIQSTSRTHDASGMLFANCTNVAITLIVLLWLSAIPALAIRRPLELKTTEAAAFD